MIHHLELSSGRKSLRLGLGAFIALLDKLRCDLSNITQVEKKKEDKEINTKTLGIGGLLAHLGLLITIKEVFLSLEMNQHKPVHVNPSELMRYVHFLLEEPLR